MIVVKNCTIDNMYYAMLGFRGYKTFIMENVVSDVFFGIGVSHLEGSIKGNVLNNVDLTGIYVDFGDLAHVVNNTVYMSAGSTGKGLEFYRMNSSNIIGNTIDGGNRGIYLQEMVSCTIIGNTISNASTVGIYSWTNCFYNYIGLNSFRSVPTYYDFTLSPTTNYFFGDDTVYGAGWNGDLGTPTKNAVYDIIASTIADLNGFPDELKNLATVEIQQLENIDATTISAAQWGYLGAMLGQPLENVVEDTSPQLGANLDAQSTYKVVNLIDPVDNQDSATKKWVDDHNWTEADITDLGSYLENLSEDASPELGGNLGLLSYIINSNDADLAYYFGRVGLGYVGYADYAAFAHRDMLGTTTYALLQYSNGSTYLNAATSRSIYFRINNGTIMNMSASGLQLGSGARVTTILDEDDMASDSATALSTQQSIKAYIASLSGIVYKTSDESTSSDTTYSDDSQLEFAVEANSTYQFEIILFYYHDPTPDFKAKLNASNNASELNVYAYRIDTQNHAIDGPYLIDAVNWSEEWALSSGVAAGIMVMEMKGTVEIGASADTIHVQWAQRVSSGTSTTVYQGSYIKWRKIS